jgi:hypothetical protein
MKKTFLISLVASALVLSSSAAATFATTNTDTKQPMMTIQAAPAQFMSSEISGTVEKLSDSEITVKTEEGVTYNVPLDQLSKVNGFNDLSLKVGTKVSLKSAQPEIVSISQKPLTAGEVDKLMKDAKPAAVQVVRALTQEEAQKLDKGVIQTVPAANISAAKQLTSEEVDKLMKGVKPGVAQVVRALTSGEVQKLGKGITQTAPAASISVANPLTSEEAVKLENVVTTASPVAGVIAAGNIKDGNLLFIASEITANGKTVKLAK